MLIETLVEKIDQMTAELGVIGLGYVGLPAACLFAEAGYSVTGVDLKAERVAIIQTGKSPIEGNEPGLEALLANVVSSGAFKATTDYSALEIADIVLIVVDTPIDLVTHHPHYDGLRTACQSLGPHMKDGALIIVESTVSPGTVETLVGSLLEKCSGKRLNKDFFLGACPERVMPGKLIANLRNLSRVCGGSTPEIAQAMVRFYRHVVQSELDVTDIVTAELVKTTENAYRDVQIAFANEVAMICEAVGADVWRVRELVNKSPGRVMLLPGAGVGGHCIPKDPWLLAAAIAEELQLHIIPTARKVNDGMPLHMADLLIRALKDVGCLNSETKVAVLGYSYLEDSDDTRNSPSEVLVERLKVLDIHYTIHDPWVHEYKGDVWQQVSDCDAVIFMVRHQEYGQMNLLRLHSVMRNPILIDGRNIFDSAQAESAGFFYYRIGLSRKRRSSTFGGGNFDLHTS
jgi:UDP-N-acetyl-D-mannosaminuronic acid dehydrogenase